MIAEPRRTGQAGHLKGTVVAGRYRVLEKLGEGPNSVVYKAEDLHKGGLVALKVIRAEAAQNSRVLARLKAEWDALLGVRHANLAAILDYGTHLELPYIAEELAPGRPILPRADSSPADAIDLLNHLCGALDEFHSRGIIHGNVTESNVMVLEGGTVKLLDFGPVRDPRQALTCSTTGMSRHAPPELLMGREPSPAADIYSIASIVFELLTGSPPSQNRGVTERCLAGPPQPGAQPEIPAPLAQVLQKCLDPDPGRRFQTCADLATALAAVRAEPRPAPHDRDFSTLLHDGPADPAEVIPFFAKVAGKLLEIHRAGQFHVDLAPSSIRVRGEGVEIAVQEAPPPQATLLITQPKYTAPELFVAQHAPDDAGHTRADIYQLGFLFYEILAGRRAFERQFAAVEQGKGGLGWMAWHCDSTQRIEPLAGISPGCPRQVADLIDKMADKNPAARIGSLEEVAAALRELDVRLDETGEYALPAATAPAPAPRRKKRRKFLLLTSVLVFVAAILLAGGFYWLHRDSLVSLSDVAAAIDRMLPDGIRHSDIAKRAGAYFGLTPAASTAPPSGRFAPTMVTPSGLMILIPGGPFVMGGDAGRKVDLASFYIDETEVTNAQYLRFCEATGRVRPPTPGWDAGYFSKPNYPVVNVSWADASAFCAFAHKRLPTEAEWEKAARGAGKASIPWGNWTLPGLANLKGSDAAGPAPVGSFTSDVSPYGVLDMAGSVQEWVAGESANTEVIRGGSFLTRPAGLSASWREYADQLGPAENVAIGFRCAADAAGFSGAGQTAR